MAKEFLRWFAPATPGILGVSARLACFCKSVSSRLIFSSAQERPLRPARETEPLTMVATGSLSSKNPASISELLDCGYHPESLLSGECPRCPPFSSPKVGASRSTGWAGFRLPPLPLRRGCHKIRLRRILSKFSNIFSSC